MPSKTVFWALLWSLIAGQFASASMIYTTGAVDFTNGGSLFSQDNYEQLAAVNFNLASGDTIRSVDFWGVHLDSGTVPADDNFRVFVFGDKSGLPDSGNVLGTSSLTLVSRTDTGADLVGYAGAHIQAYVMDLDNPIVIPDTQTYWFGVQSTSNTFDTVFGWIQVAPGGSQAFKDYYAGWFHYENRSAFNLYNESQSVAAVPEPATLTFVGMGAIGLSIGLRRRRSGQRAQELPKHS
jgi:hypothetical protein